MSPLLKLSGVNTYYRQIHILEDVDLEVGSGELVCLLGGNASAKSTTLKTILGIVPLRTGTVEFDGEDVTHRKTSYRIAKGIAIVPEYRRLFAPMTVLENLEMGAYLRGAAERLPLDRQPRLRPLDRTARARREGFGPAPGREPPQGLSWTLKRG